AVRNEARDTGIDAGADDKFVAMAEKVVRVGRLHRKSTGGRARAGSIDFAQNRTVREDVGKLRAVQAVSRCTAIAKAEQVIVGSIACLRVCRIGVDRLLAEGANMRDGLDGPARGDVSLPAEVRIGDLVRGDLRTGIGRAPILLQQL